MRAGCCVAAAGRHNFDMSVAQPVSRKRWFGPDWHARPAGLAGAALAIAGTALGHARGIWLLAVGFGLLLAAAYSRREGLLLIGPFAAREFAVAARRRGFRVVRVVIVLASLLFIGLVFHGFFGLSWETVFRTPRFKYQEATAAALTTFFVLSAMVYFLSVVVAGFSLPPVIAEERETGRLDHLLVTDLRNREILLGKGLGRLAVIVGYAALLVPVLFLITLMGGVDPLYILTVTGLTVGTLAGLAGISFASTATRPRVAAAVSSAWLYLGGFLVLTFTATMCGTCLPGIVRGAVPNLPTVVDYAIDPAADALVAVGHGNPFVAGFVLLMAGASQTLGLTAGPLLREFLVVNLVVLVIGWWVAVRRLRHDPVRHRPSPPKTRTRLTSVLRLRRRPPVGNRPVLWYELVLAGGGPWPWWWVGLGVVAGVCATGGAFFWERAVATGAVLLGPFAAFMVTVPTALRAARGIARERERDTLDGLRLTDLRPGEIAHEKWWAAVRANTHWLAFIAAVSGVLLSSYYTIPLASNPEWMSLVLTVAAAAATTLANLPLAASLGQLSSVTARNQTRAVSRVILGGCVWGLAVLVFALDRADNAVNVYSPLALFPPAAQALSGRLLLLTKLVPAESNHLAWAYGESIAAALVLGFGLKYLVEWIFRRQLTPVAEAASGVNR